MAIDIYKVINKLTTSGFTKEQAEALLSVAQDIGLQSLTTKADLKELELKMRNFNTNTIKWFAAMLLTQGALIVPLLEILR